MARMESTPAQIGWPAPNFSLPSVDEQHYVLGDFDSSKALLVAFICNHCPYVQAIEDRLIALRRAFSVSELAMVGICSNDANQYPADSPALLRSRWEEKFYGFPYLIDEKQDVARSYGAICTPDLFLFDNARKLFYRGRLDDNWRDAHLVQEESLKMAIHDLLDGRNAPNDQRPSMGCSIKWRA